MICLVFCKVITEYLDSLSPPIVLKDFRIVLNFQTGRGNVPWDTWIPIFITWGVFFRCNTHVPVCGDCGTS